MARGLAAVVQNDSTGMVIAVLIGCRGYGVCLTLQWCIVGDVGAGPQSPQGSRKESPPGMHKLCAFGRHSTVLLRVIVNCEVSSIHLLHLNSNHDRQHDGKL